MKHIVNLSSYKFFLLKDLPGLRETLKKECVALRLKGTILLSEEGFNCFIAGPRNDIEPFKTLIRSVPGLEDIEFKESLSDHQPFTRMLVKIKKEIITMGIASVRPTEMTGKRVSPLELKKWLDQKRDLVLLDTRNHYEVRIGTFKGALDLDLSTFRQFPERVAKLDSRLKEKTVVTFCTGGIRCEKATAFLMDQGFNDVYQLDGGILKYFESAGETHYDGECFVFDHRVAVDPTLSETATVLCYHCQNPVTAAEQCLESYKPEQSCPHCFGLPKEHKEQIAEEIKNRINYPS